MKKNNKRLIIITVIKIYKKKALTFYGRSLLIFRTAGESRFKLFHFFSETENEQHKRKCHGKRVRDRLGGVDRVRFVGNEIRKNVDKRYKQHEFAHDGDDYRADGAAYRDKSHLARNLYAEDAQHRAVYPQRA